MPLERDQKVMPADDSFQFNNNVRWNAGQNFNNPVLNNNLFLFFSIGFYIRYRFRFFV